MLQYQMMELLPRWSDSCASCHGWKGTFCKLLNLESDNIPGAMHMPHQTSLCCEIMHVLPLVS